MYTTVTFQVTGNSLELWAPLGLGPTLLGSGRSDCTQYIHMNFNISQRQSFRSMQQTHNQRALCHQSTPTPLHDHDRGQSALISEETSLVIYTKGVQFHCQYFSPSNSLLWSNTWLLFFSHSISQNAVLILLILVNCSDGSDSGSEVDSNHSSPQIVHLSMVCAFSRYDPMLDTVPY